MKLTIIKNSFFTLFISVFFTQCGVAQQKELNSNVKNESMLHLQSDNAPKQITDVIGATYCSGTVDTCLKSLEEIGINKADLAEKVQCAVGDFDGNGYLDFAIWGHDKQKGKIDYENFLVLFFERSKIIHCIKIKTLPGSLLLHYAPRSVMGIHGEPISANDALWVIGQTDDYDDVTKGTVYLFDTKTGNFKTIEFGKK